MDGMQFVRCPTIDRPNSKVYPGTVVVRCLRVRAPKKRPHLDVGEFLFVSAHHTRSFFFFVSPGIRRFMPQVRLTTGRHKEGWNDDSSIKPLEKNLLVMTRTQE